MLQGFWKNLWIKTTAILHPKSGMQMFKTNLHALNHHCKSTLIDALVELKISTHYCVWKNKNMLYKMQSSLIESQHNRGIRIIFWSCPSVE